jgi:glycosyltransferase involved in cell wall biosynthesis
MPSTTRTTLRIAQVAPLYESVPPQLYGGTERVVSYLTEELVARGHHVSLFASGDSVTSATLVPVTERAIRLDRRRPEPVALHLLMLEELFKQAASFDVIHFHLDGLHLPLARRIPTPSLTTLHGRLDLAGLDVLYREFTEMPLVSISRAQRAPLVWANWIATVHHGLPLQLHRPRYRPGKYLGFIGRIAPEKGVDRAIAIARRVGIPLKVAAKVDHADWDYFKERIEPLFESSAVEYIGEIGDQDKSAFLGDALALLFPIDWPEPFGLSMIEAMACGTPVIAFRHGSVPEVIDEGATGFIVNSVDEAAACVERAATLDRERCRKSFEERFTAARMARDYCNVYELLGERPCQLRA